MIVSNDLTHGTYGLYGKNSLVISKQKFDQRVINERIVDLYKINNVRNTAGTN